MSQNLSRTRWALVGSVALTLILPHLPYGGLVGWPLLLLSTLAHELGHGITAWLCGGSFARFHLYADGSGIAWSQVGDGALAQAAVSAGGLLGPAVVASGLFAAARNARASQIALLGLGITLLALDLLVVRNVFGFLYVGVVGLTLMGLSTRGAEVARFVTAFLGVQLAAAVFSRADYLFTPVAHTAAGDQPSDVAQMAEALLLPYWVWGALVGLLSLGVLAGGIRAAWRG